MEKYEIIDLEQNEKLNFEYNYLYQGSYKYIVYVKDFKYGALDSKYNVIIDAKYYKLKY